MKGSNVRFEQRLTTGHSYGIRIQNPANLMEAILDVDSDLLTVSNTVQPTGMVDAFGRTSLSVTT